MSTLNKHYVQHKEQWQLFISNAADYLFLKETSVEGGVRNMLVLKLDVTELQSTFYILPKKLRLGNSDILSCSPQSVSMGSYLIYYLLAP